MSEGRSRRDFTALENPVYRVEFLEGVGAGRKDIDEAVEAFLDGDWSAFGVFAVEAMAGGKMPGGREASPHRSFWTRFLSSAGPDERKEVLGFLFRAQLANHAIKARANRAPPAGFNDAARRALLDYLAAFKEPSHSPDPMDYLGGHLVRYSHLPDERMVALAGLHGVVEAIPALGRFLGIQRRVFKLRVDYCTSPVEIDRLVVESCRALARIGLAVPGAKEMALGVLKDALKACRGEERVWYEVYSHNNYDGSVSQRVEETAIEQVGLPPKADIIRSAIGALEGGEEELLAIDDGLDHKEPYSWVHIGQNGYGKVHGDRLYTLGEFILEAMEVATGKVIFRVDTGISGSGDGLGCYYPVLSVDAKGDPFVVTLIDRRMGETHMWRAITFDRDSGEVKTSFQLAHQPVRAWGPEVWPRQDGGIVFRMREEKRLWKQDREGKLVWERDLHEWAVVRCRDDIIGILTEEEITLVGTDDGRTLLQRARKEMLADAGVEGPYRDDLVLTEGGFFVFTREGHVMSFDREGAFRWQRTPEMGGGFLTDMQPFGDGLCGQNNDYFYTVTWDGGFSHFEKPCGNLKELLVNRHGVMFLSEVSGLHFHSFESGKARHLVPDLPYQRSLLDLTDEELILKYWQDRRFVACLPRKAW